MQTVSMGRQSSKAIGLFLAFCLGLACGRETHQNDPAAADRGGAGDAAEPFFSDVTSSRGVEFVHAAYGAGEFFFPAIMATGAALFDYDRDGDLDVFLVNGAPTIEPQAALGPPPGAGGATRGNRLFRQEMDGRFVDATPGSGLEIAIYGMGAAVGDVNNDGWPDLYLTAHGADRLFLNNRDGSFSDITAAAGIDNERWGTSAALFDFDRDGWLDLYVANYDDYDPAQPCRGAGGRLDFCNPAVFPPTADKLYRNVTGELPAQPGVADMDAVRFEDVSLSSGIARKAGAGLGVLCADFTGDGWQDVYVANDGQANFLWVNQRDGTFRDEAVLLATAYDALGRAQGSMGIALGDVNRDGFEDIVVTNLEGENNALYLASPSASFTEGSAAAGMGASFPATGFGVCLFDLENDGDLDLFVANGRVRRGASEAAQPLSAATLASRGNAAGQGFLRPYSEPNAIYLNAGSGVFEPWSSRDDPFLASPGVSRALVQGDIDNDGDLDLLITQSGGPARLLRNDAPHTGHWLMVQAIDPRYGGRDAYGALVTVTAGERKWRQTLSPCASYLGTHDPRLHFGLGEFNRVDAIEVVWPDGARERFPGRSADQFCKLESGSGESP